MVCCGVLQNSRVENGVRRWGSQGAEVVRDEPLWIKEIPAKSHSSHSRRTLPEMLAPAEEQAGDVKIQHSKVLPASTSHRAHSPTEKQEGLASNRKEGHQIHGLLYF